MTLSRKISIWGLIFFALNSIIGAAWLFGPLYNARTSGAASLLTWPLGFLLSYLIALSFIEIGANIPMAGGFARYAKLTHGNLAGFLLAWVSWLGVLSVPIIETMSLLQYANDYWPVLIYDQHLSSLGTFLAIILVFIFSLLNMFVIQAVSWLNNIFAYWKILVPIVTAICLLVTAFHKNNFSPDQWLPYGWHNFYYAIVSSGPIYAFFGFRQIIAMGGESKLSGKRVLVAITVSLLIALFIYMFVQFAFLASLPESLLERGWDKLTFPKVSGPMAGLALFFGLVWLAYVLYIDAFISPFGTAFAFTTTSSRVLYAIAEAGFLPKFLLKLNRFNMPYYCLGIDFIFILVIFLIYQANWQEFVTLAVTTQSISYIVAPACLLLLRRSYRSSSFRLCFPKIMVFLGGLAATLISFWAGWDTIWRILVLVLLGLVLFLTYARYILEEPIRLHLKSGIWFVVYIVGLGIISYFSSFGEGMDVLSDGIAYLLLLGLVLFTLIIAYLTPREEGISLDI